MAFQWNHIPTINSIIESDFVIEARSNLDYLSDNLACLANQATERTADYSSNNPTYKSANNSGYCSSDRSDRTRDSDQSGG